MKSMRCSTPEEQTGHIIINLDFGNRGATKYLVNRVLDFREQGHRVFKIRPKAPKNHTYPDLGKLYPNACTPIAGAIDYLRSEHGCTFIPSRLYETHPALKSSGIIKPFELGAQEPPRAIGCVWKFDPETHRGVIDAIIADFRRIDNMDGDTILGLELALNEVTDNIIQHSLASADDGTPTGYVMAQHHRSNNRIAVAVFDFGQGIPSSLGRTRRGLTIHEAIKASLERGVTGGNGAGNGLWMMSQIVSASLGQFSIATGKAKYCLSHHERDSGQYDFFSAYSPIKEGTTLIDFQFGADQRIDLVSALDGHDPTDLWYESHLDDETEGVRFSVGSESKGTRSRQSSHAFANLVINTISGKAERCILDFEDSPNMSASFADELILTLVERIGFIQFVKTIDFVNLSAFNRAMINSCMKNRFCRK